MTPPTFGSYLRYLSAPFFRAWWAVITGFASILSLYIAHNSTITLSAPTATTLTFAMFTMAFLVLSVTAQGWSLYTGRGSNPTVTQFDRSPDVEEGWYLVVACNTDIAVGAVFDIHKRVGSAEVPLALVRVTGRNSDGTYQAAPLGRINPTHKKEHAAGRLRPSDLVVRPFVDIQRLRESTDDIR
jgi:hypothetical protein